jgi:hypothetical protein
LIKKNDAQTARGIELKRTVTMLTESSVGTAIYAPDPFVGEILIAS